jgi:hypothetical protein
MGAAAILSVVPGVGAVHGIALLSDIPDRQSGDGRRSGWFGAKTP